QSRARDFCDAPLTIPTPFAQGIDPAPRSLGLDAAAPRVAGARVVADRASHLATGLDMCREVVSARRVERLALPLEAAFLVAERERRQCLVDQTVLFERRVVAVLGALHDVLNVGDRREANLGEPRIDDGTVRVGLGP